MEGASEDRVLAARHVTERVTEKARQALNRTLDCGILDAYPDFKSYSAGEHFSQEYAKINRMQKVPIIDYNGFVLTESVAILGFLSQEGLIPEQLYPKDSRSRARVQEYLEWQHIGLRLHCAMYFRVAYMNPRLANEEPNEDRNKAYKDRMVQALEDFNTKWLGRGHQFIVGDTITVADLWAATELEQPRVAGFDPMEKYKNIGVWREKVRAHFNPYYDEAHTTINKIIAKNNITAKL